ncbi:cytochrome P460 family protein [Acidobacteria bacterium AH-259-L09]|nr:cytochrome P460 family protein [Acidobacteria bacterium AH-259-L09]
MRILIVSLLATALTAIVAVGFTYRDEPSTEGMTVPQYDEDGALLRPKDFHTWVFVGASIGLSYSEESKRSGPGLFHNVYMQPQAYQYYVKTGKFPKKTMFAMAVYKPTQKASINRQGFFEDEFVSLEVALKDHEHFEEGWAYFDFGKSRNRATAFPKERCHSCHSAHGAEDNVFVQFYPVLQEVKKAEKAHDEQ